MSIVVRGIRQRKSLSSVSHDAESWMTSWLPANTIAIATAINRPGECSVKQKAQSVPVTMSADFNMEVQNIEYRTRRACWRQACFDSGMVVNAQAFYRSISAIFSTFPTTEAEGRRQRTRGRSAPRVAVCSACDTAHLCQFGSIGGCYAYAWLGVSQGEI